MKVDCIEARSAQSGRERTIVMLSRMPRELPGARSATEAFFYRRLETLPETAGRFRLNVELPISFDGWGKMEVDLLCAEARLIIELDAHHAAHEHSQLSHVPLRRTTRC